MNTYIPIEEENIHIMGRTIRQTPLPLFWTGSGVEFVTDATELYFDLETDYLLHEQWIRVEVDGFPAVRCALLKGKNTVCAFRGLDAAVKKTVRLIKEVQPMRADEKNQLLLAAVRTDGKLYPLRQKTIKIEFIGDSITSGEGMAGAAGTHVWAPAIFSTQGHYAMKTAQALGADVRILSQSGWGVCSSWDNDPERTLPPYYEKICGFLRGEENEKLGAHSDNDFSAWKPDAIIVNLGSNDAYAFDNPAWTDEAGIRYQQKRNPDGSFEADSIRRFEKSVYDFLVKLRKYNPNSHIIWAYGMLDAVMRPFIEHALQAYIEDSGDAKAEFLLLPSLQEGWAGANDHPGVKSHEAAAETLIRRLAELWKGENR